MEIGINARILIGIDRHWALIEGILLLPLPINLYIKCKPILVVVPNQLEKNICNSNPTIEFNHFEAV